jgi:hypothetical protein
MSFQPRFRRRPCGGRQKVDCSTSTWPNCRIRFLPSFCFARSSLSRRLAWPPGLLPMPSTTGLSIMACSSAGYPAQAKRRAATAGGLQANPSRNIPCLALSNRTLNRYREGRLRGVCGRWRRPRNSDFVLIASTPWMSCGRLTGNGRSRGRAPSLPVDPRIVSRVYPATARTKRSTSDSSL